MDFLKKKKSVWQSKNAVHMIAVLPHVCACVQIWYINKLPKHVFFFPNMVSTLPEIIWKLLGEIASGTNAEMH